jgi:hypothetical protein|uniref:Uncharacterized protein n=1 Tax=Desulfobacca acetoxidans TaxID=60893 RepID=A0A7C3UYV3_9BACT
MLKDHTVITLYPEEIIQLHTILLDGDGDEALVFLAAIKKKTDAASKPHCRPVFELEQGKTPEFITKRLR